MTNATTPCLHQLLMVGGDEYITVVLKIPVKYLIIKVAIKAQNVRMPEMRLNFNLTP
jgi:hypothetical protein